MSRLLFAAARGARIQTDYQNSWIAAAYIPTADYTRYDYRIHPADEHLQYGPISTALREMAEDSSYRGDWEVFFAHVAANEFSEYFDSWQGKPDHSWFYLILAEFLADSGL